MRRSLWIRSIVFIIFYSIIAYFGWVQTAKADPIPWGFQIGTVQASTKIGVLSKSTPTYTSPPDPLPIFAPLPPFSFLTQTDPEGKEAQARSMASTGFVEGEVIASGFGAAVATMAASWNGWFTFHTGVSWIINVEVKGDILKSIYHYSSVDLEYTPHGSFDFYPLKHWQNMPKTFHYWISVSSASGVDIDYNVGTILALSAAGLPGKTQKNLFSLKVNAFRPIDWFEGEEYLLADGKIVKIMANNAGYRVAVYNEKGTFLNYIAGCYYPIGVNDWGVLKDGTTFRWANKNNDATNPNKTIDIYTYDPNYKTIEKRRYIGQTINDQFKTGEAQYKDDYKANNGILSGGYVWTHNTDDPQLQDSEFLKTINPQGVPPNSPSFMLPSQSTDQVSVKSVTPRCTLVYMGTSGAQWNYGLIGSDLGAMVFPGDTIKIKGPGIIGGLVEGKAATTAYGAWQIKEFSTGHIVFQASSTAYFTDSLDGLVVSGANSAVAGNINYFAVGNWIGRTDQMTGPVFRGMPPLLLLLD